ncbi:MAG: sugar transferase [Bacteroidales bacterium]|jgi:lipopolysaccharide/colanic/teichoic acid biosynthesis glycosyltransferase|nr:sugar transferase [Bacteroidales bacterium]MEE1271857.1 sugar transferase [Bacteroidales bacterium]
MKRLFDITASFFGILILSPLFIFISLWVGLSSKGGVFYKQIRVGRNNKDFKLYKFRSMRVNSDKQGLLTVGSKDSRITKAGYFIRKYKIDELPQLFNVLKGDMSFVGPRPEVRRYVDLYSEEQMKVLSVRPGITDPASIKYRNENDILSSASNPEEYYIQHIMPDKLKINIDYINKRTFVKDIKIIFQTIFG